MKHSGITTACAAVLALLTACGGGGDSAPVDFTSKYVGSWQSGCATTSIVKDTAASANANVTSIITLTRVDEANMTATALTTVYAAADKTCSGSVIGTIERTGVSGDTYVVSASGIKSSNGPIKIKVDGTATVGSNTVEQITIDYPALTKTLPSNATSTAGRMAINLADYQATIEKNIVLLSGDKLTLGAGNTTAYPTALGTGNGFTYSRFIGVAVGPIQLVNGKSSN